MGKQDDLIKGDRQIKDGESQIKKFQNEVNAFNKEIERLTVLEEMLTANLKFLKKKNIVALAAEFKKAAEDLKTTKARIKILTGDRDNSTNGGKRVAKAIEKIKEDQAKLIRSMENNVVQGKFRGRNNGS